MKAEIIIRRKRVEWLNVIPENKQEQKFLEKVYKMQPTFVNCGMLRGTDGELENISFTGKQ